MRQRCVTRSGASKKARAIVIDRVRPPSGDLDWLDAAGPVTDVVLSTRIRLARNLHGVHFAVRGAPEDRATVLRIAREAAEQSAVLANGEVYDISRMDARDRLLLLERHLVSKELLDDGAGTPPTHAALFLSQDGAVGAMVNEEDHLRLQALLGGFRPREAWGLVDRLDDQLGGVLRYAYDAELGYLTSCPTNVGTGLRASVLVHLPGLVLTQEITKVLQGITQLGLTFRGLYGEGSEVVGNLFQISNQATLGRSEEDLIDHLAKTVEQVVQHEATAREVLLRDARAILEDKVWRALGLLKHARALPVQEMMNLLSGVRLGVGLKLLPEVSVYALNRIMIFTQAAHLEQAAGTTLAKEAADVHRATYVRKALADAAS